MSSLESLRNASTGSRVIAVASDDPEVAGLDAERLLASRASQGDREAYEAALAKFEEAGSLDKAQGLLDGIVSALDKDPDEEALNAFTELLQRRYP